MNKRLVFPLAAVFAATLVGVIAQREISFMDMNEWIDFVKVRLDVLKEAAAPRAEDDWYTRNMKQASLAHQNAVRQVNATYGAMAVE